MKNLVYLNRIQVPIQDYYAKAKDYFKRHGVSISFDFVQSDYKNLSYIKRQLPQGERILLQPYMANTIPIDTSYDFTTFVFNGEEFPPPNIPTGYCYLPIKQPFMDIGTHRNNPVGLTETEIKHELMHALVIKANFAGFNVTDQMDTYLNNQYPDMENSNFGKQWVLLQPYLKSLQPQGTYQYFKLTEPTGGGHTIADLKPELVAKLDKARGLAGVSFSITSGYRTIAENTAVGGVANSAHTTKEAVDIACSDSVSRFKIVKALLDVGFNRVEIATKHIHADISSTLPQNVIVLSSNA